MGEWGKAVRASGSPSPSLSRRGPRPRPATPTPTPTLTLTPTPDPDPDSLHEVVGAIDLAEAMGAIDGALAREIVSLSVRLKQMLRRLAESAP